MHDDPAREKAQLWPAPAQTRPVWFMLSLSSICASPITRSNTLGFIVTQKACQRYGARGRAGVHAAGLVRAVAVLSTFSRCQMEQKIPFRASMVPIKRDFLLHLETVRWRYVLSCVNARVYVAVCDNGRHVKRWRLPWRWPRATTVGDGRGDERGRSVSASTRGRRGNMVATESGLRGEMHEAGSYRHLGACGCR